MAEDAAQFRQSAESARAGRQSRPQIKTLGRALQLFRPFALSALVVFGLIAAEAATGIVPALVTRAIIDRLAAFDADLRHLATLVAVGVAATVFGGLFGMAAAYLRARIGQGIMLNLRNSLVDRLLGQSLSFFTDRRSGDVLSRMNNDVSGVQNSVDDTVFGLVENGLVVIVTVSLMFVFDWRLTLFVLVLLPAFALPSRGAAHRVYRLSRNVQERLADINSRMQEVLGISGSVLVKSLGTEDRERAHLRRLNQELYHLEVRKAVILQWYGNAMSVLQSLGPALIWLFGGYQVIQGNATLGTMITINTLLVARLYRSFTALGNLNVKIGDSLALFTRLFAYLDLKPQVAVAPDAVDLPRLTGSVSFENVTFRYSSDVAPAIRDVSFRIEPGQLVALVGPSGAGKTTITSLLCRFYDPEQGRVVLDGHDVRRITLSTLSRHFGVVSQETFLFHATIRENLLYAKPEATPGEIDAAVSAARLEELVARLPAGYDTVVGERGFRLSGGEKQRMAIARIILKDPRLLILDEATSHLDSVSEQLIQTALKSLFAERTSLVVAHRLSTVLAADQILVLDRGRIAEHGSHAELLRLGGLYHQLHERQFSGE